MQQELEIMHLLDGDTEVQVIKYDKEDKKKFKELYAKWNELNKEILSIGGREQLLPSGFVEGLVCIEKDLWRINNNSSRYKFDCYDPYSNPGYNKIEIKSTMGRYDITSFAPRMEWERLIFVQIFKDSKLGEFEMYDFDFEMIFNGNREVKANLENQMLRGMRPRLSVLKEFVEKGIYNSKTEGYIFR